MLDNITKKNIDDCRDVLVGKVPDPKSQIEQITLALIYKFMDDMDKEAVEVFKGKAKFFVGDFAKYGWRKLFDPSLGGKEMLELYSEALDKLQTNGNIPELFRNIFKNAFLPYKDPNTLRLFLKYINEFEYTHSEKLGDAFEYLLSVMSSQGDAGQFRTPRHIIDFIVACLDPKKNETIGDPACGTAGFLLSAYKYIVQQNTKKRLGDQLTPDQRKKMANNIIGYDISPDMVRLSLVNMYLHGFATPQIYEYDTLSSEDRWNETFDVVLANPPFMTPKGGIRPHKKFGVQANKAEVLFTDYIAEHLNKNGRAGIVVPNGIVATTQTAYKQLRKLMVEDSLIAVISLPAGCFNPYSGVKTSILMLDKGLAKKSKEVLFIKVNNDGYDLGAQRREIDKNDLPTALKAFNDFKQHLADDSDFIPKNYNDLCLLVEKEKILENKDVVLSGERYVVNSVIKTNYKMVQLGDAELFNIESGGTPSSEISEFWNGSINWATLKDLPASDFITFINSTERKITELGLTKSSAKLLPPNSVLVSSRATIGRIGINNIPLSTNQGFKNIVIKDFSRVSPKFIAFAISNLVPEMNEIATGGTFKEISKSAFSELEIPLPPLSIQEEIVKEIEGYQKIIDGAKMVVENYKPTITINPDWEMVELGEYVQFTQTGLVRNKGEQNKDFEYPYLKMDGITYYGQLILGKLVNVNATIEEFEKYSLKKDDFLYNTRNTPDLVGKSTVFNADSDKYLFNNNIMRVRFHKRLNPYYANYILNLSDWKSELRKFVDGTTSVAAIYPKNYFSVKIPIPTIDEQTQIVKRIEQEQALVNANKQLIALFEQKIKDRINEVWGVVD